MEPEAAPSQAAPLHDHVDTPRDVTGPQLAPPLEWGPGMGRWVDSWTLDPEEEGRRWLGPTRSCLWEHPGGPFAEAETGILLELRYARAHGPGMAGPGKWTGWGQAAKVTPDGQAYVLAGLANQQDPRGWPRRFPSPSGASRLCGRGRRSPWGPGAHGTIPVGRTHNVAHPRWCWGAQGHYSRTAFPGGP